MSQCEFVQEKQKNKQKIAGDSGTNPLVGLTQARQHSITQNGTALLDEAYGAAPVGHLTYTPEGYMSATITATEPEWRPLDLTFPAQPNQTDAAWAAVGKQSVIINPFLPYCLLLEVPSFAENTALTPHAPLPACSATQAPYQLATPSPPTRPQAR